MKEKFIVGYYDKFIKAIIVIEKFETISQANEMISNLNITEKKIKVYSKL